MNDEKKPGRATRLSHGGRAGKAKHGFVNPPLHRGSTVLYPDMATRLSLMNTTLQQTLTYGLQGSETHWALENLLCEIEGATHCQLLGSGLAAITTPLLAFLSAGDHLLMPDSVYGPARSFADGIAARLGITTSYYDPQITAAGLDALIIPETRVLFLESPGSHTFEMQDVPALCAAAHARGLITMMDNTWGFGHFAPFAHGIDISIQALTKYAVGHSDVVIGAALVADERFWPALRGTALDLGQYASPDDCWLTLRGLRTLAVRQARQMQSALTVAQWLTTQPHVARVFFPALPGDPGHAIWARDYTGAASLFGVAFAPHITRQHSLDLADRLDLFAIGASWGGYESLILPTTGYIKRRVTAAPRAAQVRLHIGLEDPADLIDDLTRGFAACFPSAPPATP